MIPFALPAPVLATIQASRPTPNLQVSGYVEVYGGPAFPRVGRGTTRGFRQFDIHSEEIRLARAQVALTYADPKSGFGATIKPFLGDDADILFSFDSGDLPLTHYIAEGFVTYAAPGGRFVADFGKFYSWIGSESLESSSSDLYSRGLLFTNAQPNFHTGLRLSYQATAKLGVSAYATNGWNQVDRRTSGLSWGGQLRYQANPSDFYAFGFLAGNEGSFDRNNAGSYGGIAFGNPGPANVTLFDVIATHQFDPRTRISFNANYADVADPAGDAFSGGRFYGASLVGRRDLGRGFALAGRIETLADPSGTRLGTSAQLNSAALNLDYAITPRSTFRVELRGDWANAPIFGGPNGPTRQQNTLNVAVNYRF